jgi:hypothetical protein
MKRLNVLAVFALLFAVAAKAAPSDWTYFDGVYKTVALDRGWVELEGNDKDWCGGRIRFFSTTSGFFSSTKYNIEIQGTWCKDIKLGWDTSTNNRFVRDSEADLQSVSLIYRKESGWEGFGGFVNDINMFWWSDSGQKASNFDVNLVLFADKRDDTKKQAYEKIRLVR